MPRKQKPKTSYIFTSISDNKSFRINNIVGKTEDCYETIVSAKRSQNLQQKVTNQLIVNYVRQRVLFLML